MMGAPKIRGVAIVFDSLSEDLGGFREIIKPEAVDRTLREKLDVRALVDHDHSKILGRTKPGTLRLRAVARGLETEISPPDTVVGTDIVKSIRRGDVTGMSFAFRTIKDEWYFDANGEPIREILDMKISDVSIVTYPAYAQTTVKVAGPISLEEANARQEAVEDAIEDEACAARVKKIIEKLHR